MHIFINFPVFKLAGAWFRFNYYDDFVMVCMTFKNTKILCNNYKANTWEMILLAFSTSNPIPNVIVCT